jgi:hypothetical protein
VGYTQKKVGDQYVTAFEGDFALVQEDGTVLGRKDNFFQLETKSRTFRDQFYVNLDYTLKDIAPGNYVIKTVFRDLGSTKTLTVNTPVRIE